MPARRIVLVAHGSGDPGYPAVIEDLADEVRRNLGDAAQVMVAYLEHWAPRLHEVTEPRDVVVPLLLATGFHARTDIPAASHGAAVTPALGPDRRLAAACADRLREAGWRTDAAPAGSSVILAAAGSSDPAAAADVETVAADLARLIDRRVVVAYLSAGRPALSEVLPGASAVVTYLLAPGRFAATAAACGAPVVTEVLAGHPAIAAIVTDRSRRGLGLTAP
jgi:sirohydrochlorin ferrochelatase